MHHPPDDTRPATPASALTALLGQTVGHRILLMGLANAMCRAGGRPKAQRMALLQALETNCMHAARFGFQMTDPAADADAMLATQAATVDELEAFFADLRAGVEPD